MTGRGWDDAPTEDPADEQFLTACGPWLDHPRSWTPNLLLYPDKIARVFTAIAEASGPLLIHCAGGRDRTGMIGSMLLVLSGVSADAVVANYEAGWRGAALHRGHGWSYDSDSGRWAQPIDEAWIDEDVDAALLDRRPALLDWIAETDVRACLLAAGVSGEHLDKLERLLIN